MVNFLWLIVIVNITYNITKKLRFLIFICDLIATT